MLWHFCSAFSSQNLRDICTEFKSSKNAQKLLKRLLEETELKIIRRQPSKLNMMFCLKTWTDWEIRLRLPESLKLITVRLVPQGLLRLNSRDFWKLTNQNRREMERLSWGMEKLWSVMARLFQEIHNLQKDKQLPNCMKNP